MAKTATPAGTAKADQAREDFEAAWDLFFGAIRRWRMDQLQIGARP